MSTTATRRPVKIVIDPVDHYTGARLMRRQWSAGVEFDDGTTDRCAHTHGHKTTDAAIVCGRALFKAIGTVTR